MKFYFAQAACAMSCHIALEETKTKYEGIEVSWEKPNTPEWAEIEKLNPMGAVPTLVTDKGQVLTQNIAILTYLADLNPQANLLPPQGTFERAEAIKWLAFVGSDLHPAFSPLFTIDQIPEGAGRDYVKTKAFEKVDQCLTVAENQLNGRDFLCGKTFTAADAYLFTIYGWSKWVNFPTDKYKNLNAYSTRIYQRPAVQATLKAEGLLN